MGKSVGTLYCLNTLGSAVACFLTADVLFAFFGQRTAVYFAAGCNFAVASARNTENQIAVGVSDLPRARLSRFNFG